MTVDGTVTMGNVVYDSVVVNVYSSATPTPTPSPTPTPTPTATPTPTPTPAPNPASTSPLPTTGQTTCYNAAGNVITCAGTGQDGELQMGVAWPNPRFTDNGDGAVTDNLTRLIWLKDADCFGTKNWATALTDANTLASGACGLTDGSAAGAWRLPNDLELQSLIDYAYYNPALPTDHPFTGVQSFYYWPSTTFNSMYAANACYVNLSDGSVRAYSKANT